jgi:hypothetical protein
VAHGSGVAYRLGGFDGAIPEHRAAVERWLATGWAELGCYGPDDQSVPQTHRAYGVPARGFAGGTVRA